MKPTAKLRFIVRMEPIKVSGVDSVLRPVRVLQQWHASIPDSEAFGEWKDVPLEVED